MASNPIDLKDTSTEPLPCSCDENNITHEHGGQKDKNKI